MRARAHVCSALVASMRLAACASRRAPFCAGPRVRRLPPPPRPRLRLCPGRALGVVTLSALVALSDSPEVRAMPVRVRVCGMSG